MGEEQEKTTQPTSKEHAKPFISNEHDAGICIHCGTIKTKEHSDTNGHYWRYHYFKERPDNDEEPGCRFITGYRHTWRRYEHKKQQQPGA